MDMDPTSTLESVECLAATSGALFPPLPRQPMALSVHGLREPHRFLPLPRHIFSPWAALLEDAAADLDFLQKKLVGEDDEAELVGEDDEYCYCKQGDFGEMMVACDNPECPYEWFHVGCVGLTAAPEGKWLCPSCTPPRPGYCQCTWCLLRPPGERCCGYPPRKVEGGSRKATGNGDHPNWCNTCDASVKRGHCVAYKAAMLARGQEAGLQIAPSDGHWHKDLFSIEEALRRPNVDPRRIPASIARQLALIDQRSAALADEARLFEKDNQLLRREDLLDGKIVRVFRAPTEAIDWTGARVDYPYWLAKVKLRSPWIELHFAAQSHEVWLFAAQSQDVITGSLNVAQERVGIVKSLEKEKLIATCLSDSTNFMLFQQEQAMPWGRGHQFDTVSVGEHTWTFAELNSDKLSAGFLFEDLELRSLELLLDGGGLSTVKLSDVRNAPHDIEEVYVGSEDIITREVKSSKATVVHTEAGAQDYMLRLHIRKMHPAQIVSDSDSDTSTDSVKLHADMYTLWVRMHTRLLRVGIASEKLEEMDLENDAGEYRLRTRKKVDKYTGLLQGQPYKASETFDDGVEAVVREWLPDGDFTSIPYTQMGWIPESFLKEQQDAATQTDQ